MFYRSRGIGPPSLKASIKTLQQRTSACLVRIRGNRRAHSQRSLRKPVEISTHAAADSRRLVASKGPLDSSKCMRSPAGIDELPTDTSPEPYLIARRSENEGEFCEVSRSMPLSSTILKWSRSIGSSKISPNCSSTPKKSYSWMTLSVISS
jgi:hypothetical protein